jgi:hypothetical protein
MVDREIVETANVVTVDESHQVLLISIDTFRAKILAPLPSQ